MAVGVIYGVFNTAEFGERFFFYLFRQKFYHEKDLHYSDLLVLT